MASTSASATLIESFTTAAYLRFGPFAPSSSQGYGPERFQAIHAIPGKYVSQVHYYGNNGNQLVAETFVNAAVVTRAGSTEEHVERCNLTLTNVNDIETVAEVTF